MTAALPGFRITPETTPPMSVSQALTPNLTTKWVELPTALNCQSVMECLALKMAQVLAIRYLSEFVYGEAFRLEVSGAKLLVGKKTELVPFQLFVQVGIRSLRGLCLCFLEGKLELAHQLVVTELSRHGSRLQWQILDGETFQSSGVLEGLADRMRWSAL